MNAVWGDPSGSGRRRRRVHTYLEHAVGSLETDLGFMGPRGSSTTVMGFTCKQPLAELLTGVKTLGGSAVTRRHPSLLGYLKLASA